MRMQQKIAILVLGIVFVAVGWGLGLVTANSSWFVWSGINSVMTQQTGNVQIAALVNGEVISDTELQSGVSSGFDRAIVLDRYVNKVLSAQLGEKEYPDLAHEAKRAAYREVLSSLYTTRRMQAIRETITDEQIQVYYDQNVLPENYKEWRVKYYLSNDREDVIQTLDKMKKGDEAALSELELLVENSKDGYATLAEIPYGLGRVVSMLKPGEFSEVLSIRNGFIVIQLDQTRQLDVPTLDQLREQIVGILTTQQFNESLLQARRAAIIELK